MDHNLFNFLRRLPLPILLYLWLTTILREKLIKIGAKAPWHSKYVTIQLAEVAVTRNLFAAILDPIAVGDVAASRRSDPGVGASNWPIRKCPERLPCAAAAQTP